jgi:hypothetical protein
VDNAKSDLEDYVFRYLPDITIIGLMYLIIWMVQSLGTTLRIDVYVSLLLSSASVLVALSVYYIAFYPRWEKTFSEFKAGKMCKSLKSGREETKILLTALIFMKSKQRKTKLSTVYNLEPELFARKTLIQSLYERH